MKEGKSEYIKKFVNKTLQFVGIVVANASILEEVIQ